RRVRDGVLRCSEIGFDFFKHLHDDYYGFSPEVCRLMARSRGLVDTVRVRFVGPLTVALELMAAHGIEKVDAAELGRRLAARTAAANGLAALPRAAREGGRQILTGAPAPADAAEAQLAALLEERARPSAYVRWALSEPIAMVLDALLWRADGVASAEIAQR